MKRKQIIKKGCVTTLLMSVLAMTGCQTTKVEVQAPPEYQGGMSQTATVNLLRYTDAKTVGVYQVEGVHDYSFWDDVDKSFSLKSPISFDVPLAEIVDCGIYNQLLEGKSGKLVLTNIDSSESDVHKLSFKGYATTEQFDISECQAALEFIVDDYSKKGLISKLAKNADKVRKYSPYFTGVIVPVIKQVREQEILAEYQKVVKEREKDKLSKWHINELSDTAEAIAIIKVCTEKGTLFFPGDKRAQKVLKDSESYARNDIKSKVDGKHYWDKQAYNKAHQKGLNKARYLWQYDYFTFSDQCAAMRNTVDALTNK